MLTLINHGLLRTLTLSNEDSVLQQHSQMLLLRQCSGLISFRGRPVDMLNEQKTQTLAERYVLILMNAQQVCFK